MQNDRGISAKKIIAIITVILVLAAMLNLYKNIFVKGGHSSLDTEKTSGYKLVIVVSGSMLPAMEINSLSVVEYCSINDIEVGDIVIYKAPSGINISHRVIEKVYYGGEIGHLVTKGDANPVQDFIDVTDDILVGKVIKTYNWTAKYFDKVLVSATEMDSLAMVKTIIIALLLLTVVGIALTYITMAISVFLKAISKKDKYTKHMVKHKENIDRHNEYIDRFEELAMGKGFMANVAKAIALREMKNFEVSSKDLEKSLDIALKLSRKFGKHPDKMDVDIQDEDDIQKEE